MSLLSPWVHSSLRQMTKKSHAQFLRERGSVREVQSGILQKLLLQASATRWGREHAVNTNWGAATLAKKLPVSDWAAWESWVSIQRDSQAAILAPDIERYQPTSGSTQHRKWIPYSKTFLQEIDRATAVWMHDLYETYPGIGQGEHYWSLSWLPEDLRTQMSNNDLSYFPWLKRLCLEQIMAVPDRVQNAETSQSARLLTLQFLLRCPDLSFFFVWSPTFLLGLCDELWEKREEFAHGQSMRTQTILRHSRSKAEMVRELWPKLALVSAWDTADAAPWAKQVRELFAKPLQGKGLFATEGVVSIPVQGRMHLSYQSHYYEFVRRDGVVVPTWELKGGDVVSPLISSGNGLWRYNLGDEVLVEEIYQGCPILQFIGRKQTVDMVGEKLTYQSARELMQELQGGVVLLAIRGNADELSRYELVWEGHTPEGLAERAEALLLKHHHYRLARELRQLAPLTVRHCEYSGSFFGQLSSHLGWVLGDQKWEAIVRVPHSLKGL